MATLKTFTPFNSSTETWDSYIEHFECFLEANDYTEFSSNQKRVYFLNCCGTEMFETARVLLASLRVGAVPWETLLTKLKSHYTPMPSRIAWRHVFHHRNWTEGETINNYMVALRIVQESKLKHSLIDDYLSSEHIYHLSANCFHYQTAVIVRTFFHEIQNLLSVT